MSQMREGGGGGNTVQSDNVFITWVDCFNL